MLILFVAFLYYEIKKKSTASRPCFRFWPFFVGLAVFLRQVTKSLGVPLWLIACGGLPMILLIIDCVVGDDVLGSVGKGIGDDYFRCSQILKSSGGNAVMDSRCLSLNYAVGHVLRAAVHLNGELSGRASGICIEAQILIHVGDVEGDDVAVLVYATVVGVPLA